jgi:hypothetical protein
MIVFIIDICSNKAMRGSGDHHDSLLFDFLMQIPIQRQLSYAILLKVKKRGSLITTILNLFDLRTELCALRPTSGTHSMASS